MLPNPPGTVFVCSKSQKLAGAQKPKPVPPALTEAHNTLHTLMDAHWKPTIAIKTLREIVLTDDEASVLVALLEDRLAKEPDDKLADAVRERLCNKFWPET